MTKILGLNIILDDDKMYIDLDKPNDTDLFRAIMKGQYGIAPITSMKLLKKFHQYKQEIDQIIEED